MNVLVSQLSCTSVSSGKRLRTVLLLYRGARETKDVATRRRTAFQKAVPLYRARGRHRPRPAALTLSRAPESHLRRLHGLPRRRPGATPHLHWTPSFSVQLLLQQVSLFRYMMPGSHSSPSSTLEFPHTLLLRSWKHSWALLSMVL